MIAALQEYASGQPPPADASPVEETAKFLHACNLVFEKGILSHAFVTSAENSAVAKNIKHGWRYFVEWAEEHHNKGIYPFFNFLYLLDQVFPKQACFFKLPWLQCH